MAKTGASKSKRSSDASKAGPAPMQDQSSPGDLAKTNEAIKTVSPKSNPQSVAIPNPELCSENAQIRIESNELESYLVALDELEKVSPFVISAVALVFSVPVACLTSDNLWTLQNSLFEILVFGCWVSGFISIGVSCFSITKLNKIATTTRQESRETNPPSVNDVDTVVRSAIWYHWLAISCAFCSLVCLGISVSILVGLMFFQETKASKTLDDETGSHLEFNEGVFEGDAIYEVKSLTTKSVPENTD